MQFSAREANAAQAVPTRLPVWPLQLIAAAVIGLLLWLFYGGGYVSLDAMWSLAWGRDLIHGSALSVSGTTTPHVLSNLVGMVLTPLGGNADRGLIAIEFLAAGGLVWLTGCLAREIAGLGAGLAAGVLVATREQLLFATTSTFLDVLVATLVVWAVLLVVRDPQRGNWPAAGLLLLAGLLRPEPWVLAGGLWLWRVVRNRAASGGAYLRQLALVIAAPLIWLVADRALTGDALFSVHETDRVNALLRAAGNIPDTLTEHLIAIPRNIAHSAGPEILAGAAVMALIVLWPAAGRAPLLRLARPPASQGSGLRIVLAASALFAAALSAEALGGALLYARFALPLTALLIVIVACGLSALAASAAAAWQPARPRSATWLLAALTLVICLVQVPLLVSARRITGEEHARYSAARAAVIAGVPCTPVATPNKNLRAYVIVWTGLRGAQVVDAQAAGVPERGTYVTADGADAQRLLRDKTFPQLEGFPPAQPVRSSGGWVLTSSCQQTG